MTSPGSPVANAATSGATNVRGARTGSIAWLAMVLVPLVLGAAACSSAPSNVATYDAGGSGMDALLSGTLSITAECVTVAAEGGTVWTPVFPGGYAQMAGDTLGLDDRAELLTGDPVELGGGEATGVGSAEVPKGCPTDHLWLVAPSS